MAYSAFPRENQAPSVEGGEVGVGVVAARVLAAKRSQVRFIFLSVGMLYSELNWEWPFISGPASGVSVHIRTYIVLLHFTLGRYMYARVISTVHHHCSSLMNIYSVQLVIIGYLYQFTPTILLLNSHNASSFSGSNAQAPYPYSTASPSGGHGCTATDAPSRYNPPFPSISPDTAP